jgi:hypothetical protein
VRKLLVILATLLALGLIAGCGGGDDDAADSSTDVDQLLEETFSGGKQIDSGKLDLGVRVESDSSPVSLTVSGPFQVESENTLPRLAMTAAFEGGGQEIEAGVTHTGDAAFVNFQGTDYEVSGPVYQQFKAGYEETAKQATEQQKDQSLATLGVDPRKWLTNARNAGEADVGGTETIKITGDVDVPKLLDDLNAALEKLRSLGVQGSEDLPEQLTPEQKQQAADAIEDLSVEIYTGKDDKILRRVLVALTVAVPEGTEGAGQTANARFDLTLTELNEDQEIAAPEDAKPFAELADQLGGLGLGGLGGGGAQGGGGGAGGGGAADPQALEKYSQCIQDAAGDSAEVRKCADLLGP